MDRLSFTSSNVHLWKAELKVTDQVYESLHTYLSQDENDRGAGFVFSQDQRNFIISSGILRDILSRYLGCQPEEIQFHYEPYGKPVLDLAKNRIELNFNLSHSSGYLVVAITQGEKVGVDIEAIKPNPNLELVASHSFSEYERDMLSRLSEEEKNHAFYRCWTRKEAYLKAVSSGLSIPLDSFDVSLDADNPIRMLDNRLDATQISNWSFYTFTPFPGVIGAVVIEDQEVKPAFMQWVSDQWKTSSPFTV